MASWAEIERLRKNGPGFRALAARLLAAHRDDLTEWESAFLDDLCGQNGATDFSLRQSEKLFEIRDGVEPIAEFRGFSVRLLIDQCYLARLDLSEGDEAWIVALRARDERTVRRRHLGRLLRCAREISLIDAEVAA